MQTIHKQWRRFAPHLIPALLVWCVALFALGCSGSSGSGDEQDGADSQQQLTTPAYQINCGAGAVSPFAADQFVSGGQPHTTTAAIDTSGVLNAAPAAVYQSERFGNSIYTFGSLTAGASYTVRLHFAEIFFTAAGRRSFNVLVNGAQAISGLDIFAVVGANKALVRDVSAVATANGQLKVEFVNVVDNAKVSGIEILASGGAPGNQAPTIATAAAANPNPTSGTTTQLSVLGADDAGEAGLTYTWSTSATPPGSVAFSPNSSNAAKVTTATFGSAGSYALQVTVTDAGGRTATSNVSVAVSQRLTSIAVAPASASVQSGSSQQFSASARDQFGNALTSQPTFAWSVSGGGTISGSGLFSAGSSAGGPFTVTATSGQVSGNASVSVTTTAPPSSNALYRVNSGGGAVSPFAADQFFSGGNPFTGSSAVSTSNVANAAPAAVYQSERFGNHSYTFGGLTPGAAYTVRLHFAEIFFTSAGSRKFNVLIGSTTVLTNLDIFATVGANRALVRDFSATASSSGQITVQYVSVVDQAKSSGIEILGDGTAPPEPPQPPSSVSYATDFNLSELPISEGGVWKHLGVDWTRVKTAGGFAFGTQSGNGGFDDSYAYLSGYPADQSATGVIHLDSRIDRSTTHEVELLMRWGDAAHNAHGYECNLAYDGSYAEIVRWNGGLGDFTYLNRGSAPSGVHEGDVFAAKIVGSTITVTLNGVTLVSATDSTFTSGNPGMGFWRGSPAGAFDGDYGFTRFTAASIP